MKDLRYSELPTTVRGALLYLFRHPLNVVIGRWNWKAALLSGLVRSSIFLIASLWKKEGMLIALGAMSAQFISRALFGGAGGAVIQSFSRVEPAWHATLTVPLIVAFFSHVVEFLVQTSYDSYVGTTSSGKAITASILLSILSAIFNLFAMRRGVLLVKDNNQQSLWKDIKQIPTLIFEFVSFVPLRISEMILRRQYLLSALTTLLTSVSIGLGVAVLRRKASWGVITGSSILGVLIVLVTLICIVNIRKFRRLELEYTGESQ